VHEAFAVDFPNRHSATAVRVNSMDELPRALRPLGLTSGPTLVFGGGADGLTGAALDQLRALFADTIAPLVEEAGAQVIDGATDSEEALRSGQEGIGGREAGPRPREAGRLDRSRRSPGAVPPFALARPGSLMERAAGQARRRYYTLRLVTVLGAVVIPALLSPNLTGNAETAVDWTTFAISLLVAASAAIDGFFHFGIRWRHGCGTVERLKSEGWTSAELRSHYHRSNATQTCFPTSSRAWSRLSARRTKTTWKESPARRG
jgi:hypothetical protein